MTLMSPMRVDEGEGYESVAEWRVGHESFWHSDEMRRELGDPSFTVNDDTPIVLERFRVIERLDVHQHSPGLACPIAPARDAIQGRDACSRSPPPVAQPGECKRMVRSHGGGCRVPAR